MGTKLKQEKHGTISILLRQTDWKQIVNLAGGKEIGRGQKEKGWWKRYKVEGGSDREKKDFTAFKVKHGDTAIERGSG